jgi:predicted aminopeptidase
MRVNAFPSPRRILRNAHHGMLRLWCLILLVAVVAGCATVGPWQQEGKTEKDLKTDEWYCAQQVQSMLPFDRTKMFRLCMGSRGWKEVGR